MVLRHMFRWLVPAAMTGLMCACSAPLVKSDTAAFATSGKEAATAASNFYTSVVNSSVDALDLIATVDPNCPIDQSLYQRPDSPPPPLQQGKVYAVGSLYMGLHEGRTWAVDPACAAYRDELTRTCGERCKDGAKGFAVAACDSCAAQHPNIGGLICLSDEASQCAEKELAPGSVGAYDAQPLTSDLFKPETDALAVIGEYLEVLAQLAADEKPNVGTRLTNEATRLTDIANDIGAGSLLPGSLADKASAVGKLADLLTTIAADARDARKIRQTINEKHVDISEKLQFVADRSDMDYCTIYAAEINVQRLVLDQVFHRSTPAVVGSLRSTLLSTYRSIVALDNASQKSCKGKLLNASPAARLLRATDEAQSKLIELANGNLTPEQRQQAILIALRNLRHAIGDVLGIIKVF